MTYKKNSQAHYGKTVRQVQTSGRQGKGTRLRADQKIMENAKFTKPLTRGEQKYTVVPGAGTEDKPAEKEQTNEDKESED